MNGIGLREAAGKYNVPKSTLSNWARSGMIRKLVERESRGQAVLYVETDITQLAGQYQPGRGRWNRPSLQKVS